MIEVYDGDVLVGEFNYDQSLWTFEYDADYVGNPIWEFPEIGMKYSSRFIPAFLKNRIPGKKRSRIKDEIERLKKYGNTTTQKYQLRFKETTE